MRTDFPTAMRVHAVSCINQSWNSVAAIRTRCQTRERFPQAGGQRQELDRRERYRKNLDASRCPIASLARLRNAMKAAIIVFQKICHKLRAC